MAISSIKVRVLPHGVGLALPRYETRDAAGMDLRAAIDGAAPVALSPSCRILIPTGLIFAIPAGFEGQVRPRSGLAVRHGITVLNAPGTIDADYRGEVSVILINHGSETVTIARGERIAQLVIAPVARLDLVPVDTLDETARGEGGYGSTGLS